MEEVLEKIARRAEELAEQEGHAVMVPSPMAGNLLALWQHSRETPQLRLRDSLTQRGPQQHHRARAYAVGRPRDWQRVLPLDNVFR